MNNPPSLTLTHEEVVLLLLLLKIPPMPGVDRAPLDGLSAEQARLLLGSAERSLQARELLRFDEANHTLNVEKLVMALVGTCAMPEFSVIVTRTDKNNIPLSCFFHAIGRTIIQHTISGPALHTFTILPTWSATVDQMLTFLDIETPAISHSTQPISLPEPLWQQATQLAQEQGAATSALALQTSGVEEKSATLLANTLADHTLNATVVAIHHFPKGETKTAGFVVLQGSTCWLLQTQQEEATPVISAQLVTGGAIDNHLRGVLPIE